MLQGSQELTHKDYKVEIVRALVDSTGVHQELRTVKGDPSHYSL